MSMFDSDEVELASSVSMSTSFASASYNVLGWDCGSLQFVWSGATSMDAILIPQASNDKINWCNLVKSTSAKTVNAVSGCDMYILEFFGYRWVRFYFSSQGESTGTITGTLLVTRSYGRNR